MSADRTRLALCVDVLGPLVLRVHGEQVTVPGGRRRTLLALLALEHGRTVSADRLVDSLWGDDPPGNAVQALYNHVSRLRGHLGPLSERLERYGVGYRLHLGPDEVDADAARRLARAAGASDERPETEALLQSALALWRGPALEEFAGVPALAAAAVGLEELRLQLLDDLLELRIGRGDRTVTTAAAAAAADAPLRERAARLLVESLAAAGRTAEAMAAAQGYRRLLAAETGLDASPALAELEQRVARGDLVVTAPRAAPARDGPQRLVAPPDGPMVGRQHDREEVLRLIGDHPVVTLAGPGGVGKTRLALDVASDPAAHLRRPAGAETVVVDLAAVDRPERVCPAVASTFRLSTAGDLGPEDVAAALAGRQQLLLVLDNCEHVAEACRDLVATVRRRAPGVRVLATSRVTLHLPGEHVVRLQPLPVPRDLRDTDAVRRQPAVRAFLEHARRRLPAYEIDDDDVACLVEILRRLDGLPLAIELAARQVAVMPLTAVRDRLDRALDLVTGRAGPAEERQRTLRATIDSSYRLLAPHQQELLRALATFPGGVDLGTVEALGDRLETPGDPLDVLHPLVDASLLVADPSRARYRLLFTVRTFLLDELRAGRELDRAEEHFVERCLDIAREIDAAATGPDEPDVDRRLRAELDNLRAARDVALARGWDGVRVDIAVAVADAATWRDLPEPWSWALELAADDRLTDHEQRLAVLGCAAEGARLTGDLDSATRLAEEAFRIAGPRADPALVDRAWSAWASAAHYRGAFAEAQVGWLRASEGRGSLAAGHLASAALAAAYGGDRVTARLLLDRAYSAAEGTDSGSQAAFAAYVDGEVRSSEDVRHAVRLYDRAIAEARRCGSTFVEGVARVARASALARSGDPSGAAAELGSLLESWERSGQTTQLWTTARNAASLLAQQGSARVAALVLVCADLQPGAAAVSPSIARHSGRLFVPLDGLLTEEALDDVRTDVGRLGPAGVLVAAREELARLASAVR